MGHNSQIYSTINLQFVWCYRNRLQLRLQTFFPQITTTNFNHLIIIILLTELLGLSSLGSKHKARYEFYQIRLTWDLFIWERERVNWSSLWLCSHVRTIQWSLCAQCYCGGCWGQVTLELTTPPSSLLTSHWTMANITESECHHKQVSPTTFSL